MQCTCPSYNANNNNSSHSLNRRHLQHPKHAAKAGGVKWYSSQTLPNPKRRYAKSCSCNSSSCVFSTRTPPSRNIIDPRSGNPVKSCLNISTATTPTPASRNSCYLCSRSNSLQRPRIPHDLLQHHRQRSEQRNDENQNPGPYVVSNSEFVTSHPPSSCNNTRNPLCCSSNSYPGDLSVEQPPVTPWRCCYDPHCAQLNNTSHTNWPSVQSLSNQYCLGHRQPNNNNNSQCSTTSVANIFSDATQYQRQAHNPNPLLFDDSLCQPNYLQRQSEDRGRRRGESFAEMTAGSCLSSNHESPPGSPLNIPPPPLPPLSRAPSLGGSIGRTAAAGSTLPRHQQNGTGPSSSGGGCPKCRFAVIATPTHSSRQQQHQQPGNGSVCGNNYSHFGYHHQHQKAAGVGVGNHHYGSSNSYSGELREEGRHLTKRNLNWLFWRKFPVKIKDKEGTEKLAMASNGS